MIPIKINVNNLTQFKLCYSPYITYRVAYTHTNRLLATRCAGYNLSTSPWRSAQCQHFASIQWRIGGNRGDRRKKTIGTHTKLAALYVAIDILFSHGLKDISFESQKNENRWVKKHNANESFNRILRIFFVEWAFTILRAPLYRLHLTWTLKRPKHLEWANQIYSNCLLILLQSH